MLPFPYIANTTGWYTAELGRQPWLVYNLLRTADGASPTVSAGNTLFTLLGFIGLYLLLGLLFLMLAGKIINKGPQLNNNTNYGIILVYRFNDNVGCLCNFRWL